MAFNTLEYLSQGKIDFLFSSTLYDRMSLIELIRRVDNKNDIINGFLSKLIDIDPSFCFKVIYDNDSYEEDTKKLLAKGEVFDDEMLLNLLANSSWGVDYFYEHISEIEATLKEETYHEIFVMLFKDYKKFSKLLAYYRAHPNTHIRFLFMEYILENYEDLFEVIYPDLMLYLTSITYRENEQLTLFPDLMANEDISHLAYLILKSKYKDKYFMPLKEYILANYPENDLAKELIIPVMIYDTSYSYRYVQNEIGIAEFSRDPDRLFLTSSTEKFFIIKNYPNLISRDILEHYQACYNRFREEDTQLLDLVNMTRLGGKLLEFIDKYLTLSTRATWRYIASGSTGVVYQVGDFVLKMFRTKWSYEDVICPNLFLIVKNYEEIYIRDNRGIVECGIEVQPYLKRDAKNVDVKYLGYFLHELEALGYRYTDTLMSGPCGDNCRLLDSYLDADCADPERLPNWFKEMPLVLVDRDRIYPNDALYIRQLASHY